MKNSDSRSTVSTSCIFLKIKGKSDERPKRALMGSTVESLYRVANKLFRNLGAIKAIYNEQGIYVSNVQQVIPGNTYYVSNKEPDAEKIKESEVCVANSYINAPLNGFNLRGAFSSQAPSAFYRLFGADTAFNPEFKDEVNKRRRLEYQDVLRREEEERRRREEEERRRRIEQERERQRKLKEELARQRAAAMAAAAAEEEDEMFEDGEEDEYSGTSLTDMLHKRKGEYKKRRVVRRYSRSSKKRAKSSIEDYDYYEDDEDDEYSFADENKVKTHRTIHKSHKSRSKSRKSENSFNADNVSNGRKCDFNNILDQLIGSSSLNDKLDEIIPTFKKNAQKIIGTAPQLEIKQEEFWFMNLFNSIRGQFCKNYDKIRLEDRLSRVAREIIQKHRIPIGGYSILNMKVGLSGPRHSGKSTFLAVFASELLAELVYSGGWKKTFIFSCNLQNITPFMLNPVQIYNAMCDVTIDLLGIQKPYLQQHVPFLKKFFASVLISKTTAPSIPPSTSFAQENPQLAQNFRKISQSIHSIYNEDDGFFSFIQACMLIPHQIAEAAQYTNVIFILDNFEAANYEILPSGRFANSLNTSISMCEMWKITLESSNFFISCENQSDFFYSLQPLAGVADQFSGLEVISTLGMIDDFDDDTLVKIDVDGYQRPFIMAVDCCGGCGAYIAMWNNLIDEFDRYDQILEDDPEKEEARLELITESQSVFDNLFVSANPDEDAAFLVTDVRREKKANRRDFF